MNSPFQTPMVHREIVQLSKQYSNSHTRIILIKRLKRASGSESEYEENEQRGPVSGRLCNTALV